MIEQFTRTTPFNLLSSIGNTPMIQLSRLSELTGLDVYGKMEMLNPSGSIKDRLAKNMIAKGIERGDINADTTIIEASSGNMALALAKVCAHHQLRLIIVTDPKINKHTMQILRAHDLRIEKVTEKAAIGGFRAARQSKVESLLAEIPNSYSPNQYDNPLNPKIHIDTMAEIANDMDHDIDYMLTVGSTCGTLMGCAQYIHDQQMSTKMIAVDSLGSVLYAEALEEKKIAGLGSGVKSSFLDMEKIDDIVRVSNAEAIEGSHLLLRSEGILAGGSTGGSVMALVKMSSQVPAGSKCVIIICDRGERYLDTIYNSDWLKNNFPSITFS